MRWPFVVPELARRYAAAAGPDAGTTRATIEIVFATLNRLVAVGVGEHLGYLLTKRIALSSAQRTDRT